MPDMRVGAPRQAEKAGVMQAVTELAEGGLAERMRMDAAVRVLVTARRVAALLPQAEPLTPAAAIVMRIAGGWDPLATTAAEYTETLRVADLDALLNAATHWAQEVQQVGGHAANGGPARRAA